MSESLSTVEREARDRAMGSLRTQWSIERVAFDSGWLAARTYYQPEEPCALCGTTAELPSGDCAQCSVTEVEGREGALREALLRLIAQVEVNDPKTKGMIYAALAGHSDREGVA